MQAKAVLIGSMAVGKTALSNSAQGHDFQETYQATIATGYYVYHSTVNGKPVALQIWDTAGMEQYKSLGPIYYRGSHAAIFVYDLTRESTAREISMWYENFMQSVQNDFYGILVANKLDLVDSNVSTTMMEAWAEEHGMDFLKTSAKTGTNIEKLFEMVVQGSIRVRNSSIFQENPEPVAEKKCC